MTDTLVVIVGDHAAGTLTRSTRALGGPTPLTFTYDDDYRFRTGSTPLSLTMPLEQRSHPDPVVSPWLWGLLPDNNEVLDLWARTFHVSAASAFGLLSTPVGEDCAGSARFVLPERVDTALGRAGGVVWLDESDVAQRIRELRRDSSAWLGRDGAGRFSLAGAQAKTALLLDGGRWGLPTGSVPTTHILKPGIVGLDDHDLNEHLCLVAARACGLPAASTRIGSFDGERVVVVERYDRVSRPDGTLTRVHQEDLCQASGRPPGQKYQSDGGPSSADIATLLHERVSGQGALSDVGRFTDALIFNWLIGGTDAHAKNYSLLLSGTQVRMAPLYDIGSALPHPGLHVRKLRLAMKFGGDYSLLPRGPEVWTRLAAEVGLPLDDVLARARRLIQEVPPAVAQAASQPEVKELNSDLPGRLVDAVSERVAECERSLP